MSTRLRTGVLAVWLAVTGAGVAWRTSTAVPAPEGRLVELGPAAKDGHR